MVSVFKQLERGASIMDHITLKMIHTMGALFVNDTDLYTWRDGVMDITKLWQHTQLDLETWSSLLNATGGAIKPEKCFGTHWTTCALMENGLMLT